MKEETVFSVFSVVIRGNGDGGTDGGAPPQHVNSNLNPFSFTFSL